MTNWLHITITRRIIFRRSPAHITTPTPTIRSLPSSYRLQLPGARLANVLPLAQHRKQSARSSGASSGQQRTRAIFTRSPRRRSGYLLSFAWSFIGLLSLNVFGAAVHIDDEYFFYFYPFPFALDIAFGASMLPTIPDRGYVYYRDCWSHRVVWWNLDHLKNYFVSRWASPEQSTAAGAASFRRPWRKGDVVTLYNPHTQSIVTKRIVGAGGDTVRIVGEYCSDYRARSHSAAGESGRAGAAAPFNECGVPFDARFPTPFCQGAGPLDDEARTTRSTSGDRAPPSASDASTVVVPPRHVWLEGDNPLRSTDSRHYGPVPESALRGRVVRRLWPATCACDEVEVARSQEECRCVPVLGSTRPSPFAHGSQSREGTP